MSTSDIVKPLTAGLVAGIADRYVFNNTNINSNASFAGAVAIGIYGSTMISPLLPKIIPDMGTTTLISGKTLQDRITEISVSSASAYVINRFVMQNDYNPSDMMKKIGIIVAADFIGEYASDYFGGRALSYFQ